MNHGNLEQAIPEHLPGVKFVTISLPALTSEQSARLSALGIDPGTVPRQLRVEAPSEAETAEIRRLGIALPLFDPDTIIGLSSVFAPMDQQLKFDAWIAAGGYMNDEFMQFFGIEPGEE